VAAFGAGPDFGLYTMTARTEESFEKKMRRKEKKGRDGPGVGLPALDRLSDEPHQEQDEQDDEQEAQES
jgi:hypothetical protein